MSLPEVVLWQHLRAGKLGGLRFRRQHPIGPFILDFYCPAARVCVEVDGAAHDFLSRAEKDMARDEWLASQDIRVLRFSARDVLKDATIDGILRRISKVCVEQGGQAPSTAFGGPPPP